MVAVVVVVVVVLQQRGVFDERWHQNRPVVMVLQSTSVPPFASSSYDTCNLIPVDTLQSRLPAGIRFSPSSVHVFLSKQLANSRPATTTTAATSAATTTTATAKAKNNYSNK